MRKCILGCVAAAAAMSLAGQVKASTYLTVADGDYSAFDNVPVAATSTVTGSIDLDTLQIANDSENIYFLIKYIGTPNPQSGSGTFFAVDSDNDPNTGDHIFGSPLIGSNFGYQNNFPFTQTSSSFNSGGLVVPTPPADSYFATPYNVATTEQEIRIPLTLAQTDTSAPDGYSGLVFTQKFGIEVYTDGVIADTLGPVTYSLAAVPEPATLGLLSLAALPLVRRRRSRA